MIHTKILVWYCEYIAHCSITLIILPGPPSEALGPSPVSPGLVGPGPVSEGPVCPVGPALGGSIQLH